MAQAVQEPVQSAFYHHADLDCYECLGCTTRIEVPHWAVIQGSKERVRIKTDPLNRLLWLELREIEHEKCASYKDVEKAKQHIEFGLKQIRPGVGHGVDAGRGALAIPHGAPATA